MDKQHNKAQNMIDYVDSAIKSLEDVNNKAEATYNMLQTNLQRVSQQRIELTANIALMKELKTKFNEILNPTEKSTADTGSK